MPYQDDELQGNALLTYIHIAITLPLPRIKKLGQMNSWSGSKNTHLGVLGKLYPIFVSTLYVVEM
jgi:hypothetical protein